MDKSLVVFSSTRKWLGSVSLAGLLLASSLPALASNEINSTKSETALKPLLTASTISAKETYTQTVRKQMQWIPNPVETKISVENTATPEESVPNPVAVAKIVAEPTIKVQTQKKEQPTKSITKPIQVATAVAPKPKAKATPTPKPQISRSSSSTLVDNAQSLQGVAYVYGGTSKRGFDCSGYTQYVFKGSGISLPRTSQEQFNVGSSVKKDQLQTGDLVFFTTYAKGASHVGIYVGGGKFIHASNSGVRTTSLSDSYYANRYLGARRVN